MWPADDGAGAIALIDVRRSVRAYSAQPIDDERRARLEAFLAAPPPLPFGGRVRLSLVAAEDEDRRALKGLSAYGSVKGATAFLLAAVARAPGDLEDLGYAVERAVLYATTLGLGTCWVGGVFSRSRFADHLGVRDGETMPVVVAAGVPADGGAHPRSWSERRLPYGQLFFGERFGTPLWCPADDPFRPVLEAVRRAPSATNKQPWRLVRDGERWDFYLQRTKGYGKGSLLFTALRIADLQRVDLGIAMCHFQLATEELRLAGGWRRRDPEPAPPAERTEYVISWLGA